MAPVLIGMTLLGFGALVWAGVWRRWAAWDGPPAYNAPITVVPGLGLAMTAAGLSYAGYGTTAMDALGFGAMVAGLVLYLWRPRWWGPRWYRERRERGEIRLDMANTANVLAEVVEGEPAAEAGWWSRWGRGRVADWWRATLLHEGHEVRGTLVLYRTAMAFGALYGSNDLLVIPGDDVLSADAEDGALVLALRDGRTARFRLRWPARAARRVARTLMA
jgi:hypothetical protein